MASEASLYPTVCNQELAQNLTFKIPVRKPHDLLGILAVEWPTHDLKKKPAAGNGTVALFCLSIFPDDFLWIFFWLFYSANILTAYKQESRYYSPFLPESLQLKARIISVAFLGSFPMEFPSQIGLPQCLLDSRILSTEWEMLLMSGWWGGVDKWPCIIGFSNSSLYPLGALHLYRVSDSACLEPAGDFVPILRCGYMKGSSDDQRGGHMFTVAHGLCVMVAISTSQYLEIC